MMTYTLLVICALLADKLTFIQARDTDFGFGWSYQAPSRPSRSASQSSSYRPSTSYSAPSYSPSAQSAPTRSYAPSPAPRQYVPSPSPSYAYKPSPSPASNDLHVSWGWSYSPATSKPTVSAYKPAPAPVSSPAPSSSQSPQNVLSASPAYVLKPSPSPSSISKPTATTLGSKPSLATSQQAASGPQGPPRETSYYYNHYYPYVYTGYPYYRYNDYEYHHHHYPSSYSPLVYSPGVVYQRNMPAAQPRTTPPFCAFSDQCALYGASCRSGRCICPVGTIWNPHFTNCDLFECDDALALKQCARYWRNSRCMLGKCQCMVDFQLSCDGLLCEYNYDWAVFASVVLAVAIFALMALIISQHA